MDHIEIERPMSHPSIRTSSRRALPAAAWCLAVLPLCANAFVAQPFSMRRSTLRMVQTTSVMDQAVIDAVANSRRALAARKHSPTTRGGPKAPGTTAVISESTSFSINDYLVQENQDTKKPGRGRKSLRVDDRDSVRQYMDSVCNHSLLKKNEEIILAREIQRLIKYEAQRDELENKLMRPPTYTEWAAAVSPDMTATELKRQIRRSLRAKKALTESNIRLVASIAKRFGNLGMTPQDLCQEGILGLTKACEKFDPELGFRFSTYATWWIRQSMHKALTDQSRTIRLPAHIFQKLTEIRRAQNELREELGREASNAQVAERLGIKEERVEFVISADRQLLSTETEITPTSSKGSAAGSGGTEGTALTVGDMMKDPSQNPEDHASHQMMREDISRLLCTLAPREQAVIRMRFGLDDGRPKTLEDIGDRFKVTRERVRQIEARALHKLRQPYRNHGIRCYIQELL